MAGDWIKMRNDLPDDPAVISIAAKLGLDEFSVIGRLHTLWAWADEQSRDGHAVGVTSKWLDRKVQRDGFADALVAVGWLEVTADGLTIPNFENHNGETAKVRALGTRRKQRQRATDAPKSVPPVVTDVSRGVSRTERDKTATREEKRREEKESRSRGTRLPAEWSPGESGEAYARKAGLANGRVVAELEKFRDWWVAQPGQKGAKADWQATWRTWVRKAAESAAPRGAPQAGDMFRERGL